MMVKKMLTKEKCKEAVSILKDQHEYLYFNLRANYPFSIEMIRKVQDCFEQLIKEHFDPVEKIEWLKEEMTEPVFNLVFGTQEFFHNWYQGIQVYSAENAILKRELSEYENPQPYKFEDLRTGMFVFDCIKNRVNKIIEIFEADVGIPYIKFDDGFGEWFIIEFEENRFFSLTKALEYQE